MADVTRTTRFRFWLWLIRVIGVIVPRRLRANWRQEWEAELRNREALLEEWDKLNWKNKVDLLRRSASAFWDAFWLQPKRWEDEMIQDLRFGARMLIKHPGFSLIAVLTLALGIGANAAIFSMIHTLLIQPLPYRDAGRVLFAMGWDVRHDQKQFQVSAADFQDWREQCSAIEQAAGYRYWSVNLTGAGEPERVQGYYVTANLFALLGVEPLLGRVFQPGEDRPGATKVAVLSHGLWRGRFGAERGVIGRTVALNDESYTIIGVMPPKFEFPQLNFKGDLWAPFNHDPARLRADRSANFSMVAVARLRPDRTLAQAQTEMDGIYRRLAQQYPETNASAGIRLMPMQEELTRYFNARGPLLALLAAAAFVLLIACANVANLLLARAQTRAKEMAVRAALGATALRVTRQMLTESLLLALAGGGLGVLLGHWLLAAIRSVVPEFAKKSMPALMEIGINTQVLLFAFAVALLTSLVFGLAPALRLSRRELVADLKEGGRSAGSGPRRRAGNVLVVVEVALSALLLVGAGLTMRSLWALLNVNPGFEAENLLALDITLPSTRYAQPEQRANFYREALSRLAALPGVEAVGAVNSLPLSTSNPGGRFMIEGQPPPAPGVQPSADFRVINPDYFRALGMRLARGRSFSAQDNQQGQPVTIVNQTFVRQYFPHEEPLGKRIRFGVPSTSLAQNPWMLIVGVVSDVRHLDLATPARPESYSPLEQIPVVELTLAVRTNGLPAGLMAAVHERLRALDANLPLYNVQTMEQVVTRSLFNQRLTTSVMLIFGGAALLLATVGLFGLISYAVSQRTHEFGIRLALGANTRDVLRLVIGQGLKLAGAGLLIGLAGSFALMRVMKTLLFGVSAADPLTFAASALLLLAVSLLACWVPARRAAKVDPLIALRHD
jgi:putative ABC transport system permease protein